MDMCKLLLSSILGLVMGVVFYMAIRNPWYGKISKKERIFWGTLLAGLLCLDWVVISW